MTCPVTTHSHRLAFLLGPLVGTLLLCVTSFNFINIVSSVVYAVVLPYAAVASTYLSLRPTRRQAPRSRTAQEGDILPVEAPPAGLAPR